MSSADRVVLRYIKETTMGVTPDDGVKATATLTGTVNFSNAETVTINGKVYTFQTSLTNGDGNVKIGATLTASLLNLKNAINRDAGVPGTDYAVSTVSHGTVECTSSNATTAVIRARRSGTAANAYGTTDTATNASWGGATMAGGTNSTLTALKQLRYTSESMNYNIENTVTAEITPTRVETDLVQVAVSSGGGFNFELSYGTFDDWLEAALGSTFSGVNLDNGTTLSSFLIQKAFEDMSPVQYHDFNGVVVDELNLNMEVGKIITGSVSTMAFGANIFEAQIGGATFPAVSSTTPMSAVANLQAITIDGVPYTGCIMTMNAKFKNNLRAIRCVGSPTARDMKFGKFQVTGDLQFYFNEGSNFKKFVKGTEFALAYSMIDGAGNTYTFTFPRCKFESGEVVAGGTNTDTMFSATYRALYDSVTSRVVRITK